MAQVQDEILKYKFSMYVLDEEHFYFEIDFCTRREKPLVSSSKVNNNTWLQKIIHITAVLSSDTHRSQY